MFLAITIIFSQAAVFY